MDTLVDIIEAEAVYLKAKFNLKIKRGEVILLSGKNGSGKTTLIKLLLKLIPLFSGSIKVNTKRIGYLPDSFDYPEDMRVIDFFLLMSKLKGDYKSISNLYYLDINIHKKLKELSKGNIQKLMILITIMGDADLIILDEPFSNIDETNYRKLLSIIKKEKTLGKAFLLTTHKKNYISKIINMECILD